MDPLDGSVTSPTECDASTGNGMSMADDPKLRSYRSNDPYRQAGEPSRPSEQASDPLAELARLIGQKRSICRVRAKQFAPGERVATDDAPATARTTGNMPPRASRNSRPTPLRAARLMGRARTTPSQPRMSPRAGAPTSADSRSMRRCRSRPTTKASTTATGSIRRRSTTTRCRTGSEADYDYQDDVPLEPHEDEMYDDPPRHASAQRSRHRTRARSVAPCSGPPAPTATAAITASPARRSRRR